MAYPLQDDVAPGSHYQQEWEGMAANAPIMSDALDALAGDHGSIHDLPAAYTYMYIYVYMYREMMWPLAPTTSRSGSHGEATPIISNGMNTLSGDHGSIHDLPAAR